MEDESQEQGRTVRPRVVDPQLRVVEEVSAPAGWPLATATLATVAVVGALVLLRRRRRTRD